MKAANQAGGERRGLDGAPRPELRRLREVARHAVVPARGGPPLDVVRPPRQHRARDEEPARVGRRSGSRRRATPRRTRSCTTSTASPGRWGREGSDDRPVASSCRPPAAPAPSPSPATARPRPSRRADAGLVPCPSSRSTCSTSTTGPSPRPWPRPGSTGSTCPSAPAATCCPSAWPTTSRRSVEAARAAGVAVTMITTAITSARDPHAEAVLADGGPPRHPPLPARLAPLRPLARHPRHARGPALAAARPRRPQRALRDPRRVPEPRRRPRRRRGLGPVPPR